MSKELKPTLCIVAGPNGSGKTSTTIQLLSNEWSEGSMILVAYSTAIIAVAQ